MFPIHYCQLEACGVPLITSWAVVAAYLSLGAAYQAFVAAYQASVTAYQAFVTARQEILAWPHMGPLHLVGAVETEGAEMVFLELFEVVVLPALSNSSACAGFFSAIYLATNLD